MPPSSASTRAGAGLALAALCAALSACAGAEQPDVSPRAGLACVNDSLDCIGKRKATLKALTDDPQRAWVKETPTPEAYASGVRLFAYKNKKKDLSCDELLYGRKEADGAGASLKSAGTLLTPAQVARGRMLAVEVSRELAVEHAKRCRKG
jgi:hypothetical protein